MAILTITSNRDFRIEPPPTDIDRIAFAPNSYDVYVRFTAANFGPGLIADDVTVEGGNRRETVIVYLESATAFSAAGWTFQNWNAEDDIRLEGSVGAQTITGSNLSDYIYGGDGNDTLLGGEGNDRLSSGDGEDLLVGGSGDDIYFLDSTNATIVEGTGGGTDQARIYPVNEIITLPANVENMFVSGFGTALGNELDNVIELFGYSRTAPLTVAGGDGSDTYLVRTPAETFFIIEDAGAAAGDADTMIVQLSRDYPGYHAPFALAPNIENVISYTKRLIEGNASDNLMSSAHGSVNFNGGAGDDTLQGGDIGADVLNGGDGNDLLEGNEGHNHLVGGDGNDTLVGGNTPPGGDPEDILSGGAGDDWLEGRSGPNELLGGDGNDTITGGDDYDFLDGGGGADTLIGGLGNDTYWLPDSADMIVDTGGRDTIVIAQSYDLASTPFIENLELNGDGNFRGEGTDEKNFIGGNSYNNLLKGWGEDDRLEGYLGSDTLRGGVGDDRLGGGSGADKLFGEDGRDTLAGGDDSDTLYGGLGNDLMAGDAGDDTLSGGGDNDKLSGGESDDRLQGDAGDDALNGGPGHDLLLGGDGNDLLNGGGGLDTLDGGAGNDTLVAGTLAKDPTDVLMGGDGNDSITGGLVQDTLQGGAGDDTLTGGAKDDVLIGGSGNDVYNYDSQDSYVEGPGGGVDTLRSSSTISNFNYDEIERLVLTGNTDIDGGGDARNNYISGNSGHNVLVGRDGNDTLLGGAGDDTINGGSGRDVLRGGAGDDVYVGAILSGPASDYVLERANEGTDTLQTTQTTSLAGYYIENLILMGNGAIDGTGNAFANIIRGTTAANRLDGAAGNDTIDGLGGSDTIYGGDGDDLIDGGGVNDVIIAGGGNDTITGGTGADTINGGGGADLFRFLEANTGTDQIDGFATAVDRFVLTGDAFASRTEANGNTTLVHDGGTILVTGVTGLSLAQWNALVIPSSGTRVGSAAEQSDSTFSFHLEATGLADTDPVLNEPRYFNNADYHFA